VEIKPTPIKTHSAFRRRLSVPVAFVLNPSAELARFASLCSLYNTKLATACNIIITVSAMIGYPCKGEYFSVASLAK